MSEKDPIKSMTARLAAHESWARTENRSARTAKARAALQAKFELEVDPDGSLPPAERARRAEHARKAYYTRLALKSAKARRDAARLTSAADQAEAELREVLAG